MESVDTNSIPSYIPQESDVPTDMASEGGQEDGENNDTEENENATSQSGLKRKHTSEVWNHFIRVMLENIQYAECNYCKTRLKAPPSHGTTHLKKHYDKTCKKRPRKMDIRQSVLMMNKNVGGVDETLTAQVFNQEESRHELANMVIMHDYPLSIVDHIGFRRYSASLQPCFTMISRNTLKSDILKLYNAQKTKCYKVLDKLKGRIAITTDMWTSDNSKKGFMAITGHYIDDSWTLRNIILRFVYVPAPHTAEAMADVLVEAFMSWNIDHKVSTITVDNCSTNDAMLSLIPSKIPKKNFILGGKKLHMRCCAHILNLIVRDGLEVIHDAVRKIRESVVYWTASPSRVEKFKEAATQVKADCSKMLALDVKTRWNSTYLMLEIAIKYKDAFDRLTWRERTYTSLPSEEEWENARELCDKLKLFYEVTEMFSGTLFPTSNFYFPKICHIKLELRKWSKSSNLLVKEMAEKMIVIDYFIYLLLDLVKLCCRLVVI